MDLIPAILLLVIGTSLLLVGFRLNKDTDQDSSQSSARILRQEISTLRDEVRRNDAKNDYVQREIMLMRAALPGAKDSGTQSIIAEDNVKGLFASGSRLERNREVVSLAKQGLSSTAIAQELSMSQETVSTIINKYKRARV